MSAFAGTAGGLASPIFDIRNYGALTSPNDIGPAVQAAMNACSAYGGGTIYIPARQDARAWGWSSPASLTMTFQMSMNFIGDPGQTAITIPTGLATTILSFGNSNAICQISDLIFLGDQTAGTNCACVIDMHQSRITVLSRLQFFGLDCNGLGHGIVKVTADTTHIYDLLFVGCNYSGTATQLHFGGCLSVTGQRDACIIDSCRFTSTDGTFDGVTYNKSNSGQNVHLWIGAQGLDERTGQSPTAYGEVQVRDCYFESLAVWAIDLSPESPNVLDRARIEGCTFNQGNTFPAIYAGNAAAAPQSVNQLLVEGCHFGNAAAGQPSIHFSGIRCVVRGSHAGTGGKTLKLTGATQYVEFDESDGFALDVSVATPTYTVTKFNGVYSDLYTAASGVTLNQLVKATSTGIAAVGTGDTIDKVLGPAQATVSASALVSVGRPGQPWTLLSDGSATIAIGDNVSLSTTSAGRVKTVAASAVDRVGIALQAATNVADTPVRVMFLPLKS